MAQLSKEGLLICKLLISLHPISADTLVIDTIATDNRGRFRYRCHIDTMTTFSLYLNNYQSAAVVFANYGEKIRVEGDAQLPDLIKVNGNEINDELTSFKTSNIDLLTQRGQLLLHLSKRNNRFCCQQFSYTSR